MTRALRATVIASNFPPAGGGGIQRTVSLVRHLCARGWEIAVVTRPADATFLPRDDYFAGRVPDGVRVVPASAWRWNLPFRALARLGLPGAADALTRFFGIPDTNLGWIGPAARAAGEAGASSKPDLVYATAPEHAAHWAGRAAARRMGVPLVLDFRDDYVGNPMVPLPTPIHRWLASRMERRLLSSCAAAVFNTPEMTDAYRARYPGLADRFDCVPNGYQPEDLAGTARDAPPRAGGICRILYSGSLYGARTLAPVLEALASLAKEGLAPRERVQVDIVGARWVPVETPAPLEGRIRPHGYLPREGLLALYRDADILLSCEDPARTIAVPGKMYEHIALGRRPLFVGATSGAPARLLREAGVGAAVHPGDAAGLREVLAGWIRDVLAGIPPPAPDPGVLARHRRDALNERLEGIMRRAAGSPATSPVRA